MDDPMRQPTGGSANEAQLVTFFLKDEEFAFDIMSVHEIIRQPRTAKVPGAPSYVDGIANLRGVVLPVIDLRIRFGMDRAEDTERTRVLVVDVHGTRTAFRVDRVNQVIRVLSSDITPAPAAVHGTSSDALDGVVQIEKGHRMVMVLNAARAGDIDLPRTAASANSAAPGAKTGPTEQYEASTNADAEVQKMVTFRIAKEEFAFQMSGVREILRMQTPSQVPDVADYVRGILTVRDQILPIIDMRRLLGFRSLAEELAEAGGPRREDHQRIIVVDAEGVVLGIVVDHVHEVLSVPTRLLEPPPAIASRGGVALSGVAKLGDGTRLVMVLDVANLVKSLTLGRLHTTDHRALDAPTTAGIDMPEAATQGADAQLVTFMLDAEEYGIPIAQVQQINRVERITTVPTAAPFIEGITNLRGEIIPVLNTRTRFGLEVRPADDRTRLIIVNLGGVKTGLVVDSVREVLRLDTNGIVPPPEAITSGIDEQFISGVGQMDGGTRMIVLLDVQRVLSPPEQATRADVPAA